MVSVKVMNIIMSVKWSVRVVCKYGISNVSEEKD